MTPRDFTLLAALVASTGCYSGLESHREVIVDGAERLFPAREADEHVEGWFAVGEEIREVHYELIEGHAVLDGDIVLGLEHELTATERGLRVPDRSAVRPDTKWKNARVMYQFDPVLPESIRERVRAAMKHWKQDTRVRFVKRTDQADYVRIVPADGCASELGRQGGEQLMYLGEGCSVGNIIHEIGHTVGLYHEQSRTDRGKHIVIKGDNIDPEYRSNFWSFKQMDHFIGGYAGANIGAYDFGSIMHYPSDAFTRNGEPTIVRKNGGWIEGQRDHLSAGDRKGVAFLYGSPAGDPPQGDDDAPAGEDVDDGDEPLDPGLDACWLDALYDDVLQRSADPDGHAAWLAALQGGMDYGAVAGGMLTSDEARTAWLGALYVGVLHREPDAAGREAWLDAMRGGMGERAVTVELVASAEYWASAGSDASTFVTRVYVDLLGREPGATEVAQWLAADLTHADARRALAVAFLDSDESRGRVVDAAYARWLGRAADADGRAAYVAALGGGLTAEVMAIEMLTSVEYFARCGS